MRTLNLRDGEQPDGMRESSVGERVNRSNFSQSNLSS